MKIVLLNINFSYYRFTALANPNNTNLSQYNNLNMTHQEHIDSITASFKELATNKYFKGAKEHGGNLWEKKGLIDMAIEEAIDQVIYLMTLKKQMDDSNHIYGHRVDTD